MKERILKTGQGMTVQEVRRSGYTAPEWRTATHSATYSSDRWGTLVHTETVGMLAFAASSKGGSGRKNWSVMKGGAGEGLISSRKHVSAWGARRGVIVRKGV
jgi:hypothetical protein